MKRRVLVLVVIILNCLFVYAQPVAKKFIAFNNTRLNYEGRVGITDSCAAFYWSGSNIGITVKDATTVEALLADTRDNNFFYVIVDGDENNAQKINVSKEKKLYTLASFIGGGKHHVELFKVTNTDDHTTRFYGFEIDEKAMVLKPRSKPKRKLEFFGNSITCGHGADVPVDSADSGAPQYFNNYKAYGAITARHFGAQYHCTAKSGIGIMVSWFAQTMPEIYDRLNPNDAAGKWDFKKYQPDIVVVNLFQNDSWIVNQPANEQFKAKFGTAKPSEEAIIQAYANFIRTLRTNYSKAKIICCLGSMDIVKSGSKWPGYVDAAVAILKDKNIVTHYFKYKNTPGHPKAYEQQAMADELIAFIKTRYWK